ncbi:hypothetical protein KK101_04460 [Curtobacterium flaccumfaciens pv. oortii]|uniref:hypothetical protein n=1 Tax=Curtobacterium flaccumfaciens TaxID=2035 RepID=UPI001BDE9B2C|nr:hypothetical protein [Curtobacterium flaccumfaciens]MBT1621934.1 hypothetical protein [Curtobacterium flaccumfaciens pv. oortii]
MSMSAPFDPEQQGRSIPVDGSDESELEMEEDRGDDSADPSVSPVSHHEEDEAGGGPVFRRPHAGERLHPDDL